MGLCLNKVSLCHVYFSSAVIVPHVHTTVHSCTQPSQLHEENVIQYTLLLCIFLQGTVVS